MKKVIAVIGRGQIGARSLGASGHRDNVLILGAGGNIARRVVEMLH